MAVQAREFIFENPNGDVLFSASRVPIVRKWIAENRSTLPNGEYWIRRKIRTFFATENQTEPGDQQGNWKDKRVNIGGQGNNPNSKTTKAKK